MDEMTKAVVVDNLIKGIHKMVDIQWELAELQLLDSAVRQTLLDVGEYYVACLVAVDPFAAIQLMAELGENRAKRDLTGR